MNTTLVVGSRVEFLRDALPAKAGDTGTVDARQKRPWCAGHCGCGFGHGHSIANAQSRDSTSHTRPDRNRSSQRGSRRTLKGSDGADILAVAVCCLGPYA